jgi:hypothetical protein
LRKTAYFTVAATCVKTFLKLFKLLGLAGLFESAYFTAHLVIVNNYLNFFLPLSFNRVTVTGSTERGGELYVDLSYRQ